MIRSQQGSGQPLLDLVNLGAGENQSPVGLNIDGALTYRLHALGLARWIPEAFVGRPRLDRLRGMHGPMLYHDLSRGIPLPDNSVRAVYHQHMLEHLERTDAPALMAEIHRVLVPGGLHRICLPDLWSLAQEYCRSYILAREEQITAEDHEQTINALLEQSVRLQAAALAGQSGLRAIIEGWVLGDARRRKETHQWMYDRISLEALLQKAGFTDITVKEAGTSAIPDWPSFGLELSPEGEEKHPGSLYMEARKP